MTIMISLLKLKRLTLPLYCVFLIISFNLAAENIPTKVKQHLLNGQFNTAAKELEILAANNSDEAKYHLAVLLLNGQGIEKSPRRAEKLLTESSEISSHAALLLGRLYYKGKQLEKNNIKAKYYLTKAASFGNKQAQKLLKSINASTSNGEIIKPQTQRLFNLAISSGKLSLVIKQYLNGAKLNQINSRGNTPLIQAISLDREDIVRWLIKRNVDVKQTNLNGDAAPHIAAKLGKVNYLILMNNKNVNLDLENALYQTPLMLAIINGHVDTAQWLVNNGSDSQKKDSKGKAALDYNLVSGLDIQFTRIRKDSSDKQKHFEHKISSLSKQSKNPSSAYYEWPILLIAVAQDQLELAKHLISIGHSPWLSNKENSTALSLAVKNGYSQFYNEIFLKYPLLSAPNDLLIESLFFEAVNSSQTSLIGQILSTKEEKAKTELVNKAMNSAITAHEFESIDYLLRQVEAKLDGQLQLSAIGTNNFKIAKLVIEKLGEINYTNTDGVTPLILAAKLRNHNIVSFLLDIGADISIKDKHGLTALMWATKQDCNECVSLLLKNGADSNLTSLNGNNSVMLAAKSNSNLLRQLINSKTNIHARNNRSLTALMIAVNHKCIDCVKMLLENGANPRRKNSIGQDALDMAENNSEILAILEEY